MSWVCVSLEGSVLGWRPKQLTLDGWGKSLLRGVCCGGGPSSRPWVWVVCVS